MHLVITPAVLVMATLIYMVMVYRNSVTLQRLPSKEKALGSVPGHGVLERKQFLCPQTNLLERDGLHQVVLVQDTPHGCGAPTTLTGYGNHYYFYIRIEVVA